MADRNWIAWRVAQELKPGDVVNLGIGIPTMVPEFIPAGVQVLFQSEVGIVGVGPSPQPGEEDWDLVNAAGKPVTIVPGGSCFDSATSFALIRGGHIDVAVLGALQVDEEGNLANWLIPGKFVPGMGGGMDLAVGAKKLIVAMEHTTSKGEPKILKRCTLPLTAAREVDLIVTDLAVMEVTSQGLVLRELAPGATLEEVRSKTEANFAVDLH